MNSNLDVLCVNIISCTSNFLEFEACINTLLGSPSSEWKSSISLMQSLNYFTPFEMFMFYGEVDVFLFFGRLKNYVPRNEKEISLLCT